MDGHRQPCNAEPTRWRRYPCCVTFELVLSFLRTLFCKYFFLERVLRTAVLGYSSPKDIKTWWNFVCHVCPKTTLACQGRRWLIQYWWVNGFIPCDAMIQCHDSLCEDAHFVGKDRWVKLIGLWDPWNPRGGNWIQEVASFPCDAKLFLLGATLEVGLIWPWP